MLLIDSSDLERLERQYPGIAASVRYSEEALLPPCCDCGGTDTARVAVGLVGRTIAIAAATTRFILVTNEPIPGRYFCNRCGAFFD